MITQVCIASTTKLSQIFKTTFEEFRWIEENYRGYNLENIVTRRVYHSHITMDTGRVSSIGAGWERYRLSPSMRTYKILRPITGLCVMYAEV